MPSRKIDKGHEEIGALPVTGESLLSRPSFPFLVILSFLVHVVLLPWRYSDRTYNNKARIVGCT